MSIGSIGSIGGIGASTSIGINNSASSVAGSIAMQSEDQKTLSFQKALEAASASKDDAKLKQACEDFESYFVQLMFKEMRKSVDTGNSFIPKSNAENIFQDMLDEEVSKSAASGPNGLGMAQTLYKQLSKQTLTSEDLE